MVIKSPATLAEDRGTERVIATQLAEALPIKDMDIARSFGMHPVSLSRFKAQAREAGAAALMPKRLGPKGPSKLTAQLEKQIRELAGQELSCRAIAKRLCRGKRKISYGLVASVLKREQSQAQAPLAMELPAAKVEASERKELVSVGERRHSRYAGALMLFASLTKLDLFGILESLGASSGPSRRLGWKQAVSALVFCYALRFRSVEDSKNALREDLGVILGERRSPSVQSLRKKVCALAESVDPVTLSRSGSQRHQARRLQLRETSCASLQRLLRTAQGRLQRLPGTIAVARRRSNACRRITSKSNSSGPTPTRSPQLWKL